MGISELDIIIQNISKCLEQHPRRSRYYLHFFNENDRRLILNKIFVLSVQKAF